jgi:uncharacterized protein DUF4386
MVVFGPQVVAISYLIVGSTFVPRLLAVMVVIGGSGYVAAPFATFYCLRSHRDCRKSFFVAVAIRSSIADVAGCCTGSRSAANGGATGTSLIYI